MSQSGQHKLDTSPIPTGLLILVVGPSGAGKDALLNAARAALAEDERFFFARRVITRDAQDSSESHDVMTPEAFDRAAAAHEFLLSWHAHGLGYAIPASARDALWASRVVVANVSRSSIEAAERLIERVAVVHVTAPAAVLAQRIAARGREPEELIVARLARQVPLAATRAPIIEISNGGALKDASQQFVGALRDLAGPKEGGD